MAHLGLDFSDLDAWAKEIVAWGGKVKPTAEKALRETHRIVTDHIQAVMSPSNMPAKGKYWTGDTLEHLRRNAEIEWDGDVGSVGVGFEIKEGGITSIFLMYGTPRHKPPMKKARGLYDAIYGKKVREEIADAQATAFAEGIIDARL